MHTLDIYREAGRDFHEALSGPGVLGTLDDGTLANFTWNFDGSVDANPLSKPAFAFTMSIDRFVRRTADVSKSVETGVQNNIFGLEVSLVSYSAQELLREDSARRAMNVAVVALSTHIGRGESSQVGYTEDMRMLNDRAVKAELDLRVTRNKVERVYSEIQRTADARIGVA